MSILIDRKFRLARLWSNRELRKVAPLFHGDVVNVSGWDDRDKEGAKYREYFVNAKSYSLTNYPGFRGFQGQDNECVLDLTKDLPRELIRKFDVVFNHTTLEHIFDVRKAFENLCDLSKDIVIVVVPFSQVQHESESWKDFWRFTPSCLRTLLKENAFEVIYESESPMKRSAIYLFFVGSRHPERWTGRLPYFRTIAEAGHWIGDNGMLNVLKKLFGRWKSNNGMKILLNMLSRCRKSPFSQVLDSSLKRRNYRDYDHYLAHQAEKLTRRRDDIEKSDREYETILKERFCRIGDFKGKSVLCLGARLGGEVRAFKSLGALSVGIDIEPGEKNPHVMYGDFHDLKFPDCSFDAAFTNALDHVYDLDRVVAEVARILQPNSLFYVELAVVVPGKYEVIDTSDPAPIVEIIQKYFELISSDEIVNKTNYIDWKGIFYCFRKLD